MYYRVRLKLHNLLKHLLVICMGCASGETYRTSFIYHASRCGFDRFQRHEGMNVITKMKAKSPFGNWAVQPEPQVIDVQIHQSP